MSFQTDVLDKIARIVGGTVSANNPTFFSGALNGNDGTGVTGLTGCYSAAPDNIQAFPVGIVMSTKFTADLAGQGSEKNEDHVRLVVLVSKETTEDKLPLLTPYRDSVPAAFRAHMGGFGSPGAIDFYVTAGDQIVQTWSLDDYLAWDFTVRVRRLLTVTYTP